MDIPLEFIAGVFGADPSTIEGFECEDSFNKNTLKGYMCKQSDHRYGALVITHVNDKYVEPQLIYCTPKLHYPFSKTDTERKYHFPAVKQVKIYEKWDGTNICCYGYTDSKNQRWVTFKTRLSPVLQNTKYGPFLDMWTELLYRHPLLRYPEYVVSGKYTLSYEMFGYRNKHTIMYDEPLDVKLLFGVDQQTANVCIPEYFTELPDVVLNKAEESFFDSEDLIGYYETMRDTAEARIEKDEEGVIVEGTEGYVLYLLTDEGKWRLYKCKPHSIEKIHWESDTIPMSEIVATVQNAIADIEDITVDQVVLLLKEEYSDFQIQNSMYSIPKAIDKVLAELEWKGRIVETYYSVNGHKNMSKQTLLRKMSEHFDKKEMNRVFNTLQELKLLE